jgi:D-glycero-alpha-D-manno-heptose-7-phosphate kinase
VASTEAQRSLHAGLIGPTHEAAIALARSLGAAGWKVNGAGGEGGSLTIVAGSGPATATAAELAAALIALDPTWEVLDLRPSSSGVTVSRRGRRLPSRR